MPISLPSHINGLLAYLCRPEEKANEDLALAYFRKEFGERFTRQQAAKRSDGYVVGHFVLELKSASKDWLNGLLQGLAYRNLDLDFSQIVVAAKGFLAIWLVDNLPEGLRHEVLNAKGAPNAIGNLLAQKYSKRRKQLLELATWHGGAELSGSLFSSKPDIILEKISTFKQTLAEGRKVRQRITPENFVAVLTQMKSFFDPAQPIKTVRAFYSMAYAWSETSTLQLSQKASDQATLGGEVIRNLVPARRSAFKDFVDNHYVFLREDQSHDEFFSRYDAALDAVDKEFRIKNGIFFTDLDLSKFVMWLTKQEIPDLGKNGSERESVRSANCWANRGVEISRTLVGF